MTDEPAPSLPPPPRLARAFAPVEFDLTDATLEQWEAVFRHVRDEQIYSEQRGNVLSVPGEHADAIASVLERSRPMPPAPIGASSVAPSRGGRRTFFAPGPGAPSGRALASRLRRAVRFVVDDLAWALLVAAANLPDPDSDRERWISFAVSIAAGVLAVVVPTALTGRSAGAVVTRTEVERVDGVTPPGWRVSFVRWLVPAAPWHVLAAVYILPAPRLVDVAAWALTVLATVAVYAGVVVDGDRRGLHDRAAGTVVVRR